MAEYTQKFPLGAWVKGTTTDGADVIVGYVSEFDSEDGQHYVRGVIPKLDEEREAAEGWCAPDELSEATPPEWIAPTGPTHAFVCDWMDDHVPNVALYANPEDVLAVYGDGLDDDELGNLKLKLMECVVDPGERIELAPGGVGVRFCVVNDDG